MRSRTSDWFETKIRYAKTQEDGTQKNVTETYIVDALSFTEAESAILEQMKVYISGDYKIINITPTTFHEVFFTDVATDDKWYKCKLAFVTIDEKTEKEKHSFVTYLVQGKTLGAAVRNIDEVMSGTMIDYYIVSVTETTIIDVFEHEASLKETVVKTIKENA